MGAGPHRASLSTGSTADVAGSWQVAPPARGLRRWGVAGGTVDIPGRSTGRPLRLTGSGHESGL